MRNIVIVLILTVSNFVFASDSGWDVSIHNNEWATMFDTHQGDLSLTEAVNSVPKGIWLRNFRVFLSEDDHVLQKELHEFLNSNYPELHAEALSSAGNMHNPKVISLREPIKQAILALSLAKKIGAALTLRCERIASTSYEKFMIRKKMDNQSIALWFGYLPKNAPNKLYCLGRCALWTNFSQILGVIAKG